MPDLDVERRHLVKADQHIVDGERRVSAQLLLIERFQASGQDTREAKQLFLTLQQTLQAWQEQRILILQEITRQESASS